MRARQDEQRRQLSKLFDDREETASSLALYLALRARTDCDSLLLDEADSDRSMISRTPITSRITLRKWSRGGSEKVAGTSETDTEEGEVERKSE